MYIIYYNNTIFHFLLGQSVFSHLSLKRISATNENQIK